MISVVFHLYYIYIIKGKVLLHIMRQAKTSANKAINEFCHHNFAVTQISPDI